MKPRSDTFAFLLLAVVLFIALIIAFLLPVTPQDYWWYIRIGRDTLAAGFRTILPFGRKIDEPLLDQLTDSMLAGDMGPKAVVSLMSEVRTAWKQGKISESGTHAQLMRASGYYSTLVEKQIDSLPIVASNRS